MPKRIVIIGGAQAGPTAAARAREIDESASITMLERAKEMSYAVGGLVHYLSGEVDGLAALEEGADYFQSHYGVEVRTSAEVVRIDAGAKKVVLADGALPYDTLVVATGVASSVPEVLADGASNVFVLRRPDDVKAIVQRVQRGAKKVCVVGGGFFGLEAADALRRRKCRVTLLERGARILPQFGEMAAHHAAAALERRKIGVITNAEIVSVQGKGKKITSLSLEDGTTIPTDLVVVAAGVQPRSELLAAAGAAIRDDGSVIVDRRCQTSLPDVYACGASIALEQSTTGLPLFAPQAAVIDKTAQVAGACAAGGDVIMGPIVGSAVTRVGDTVVACTGLAAEDAFGTATVCVPDSDRFMPSSREIHLQIHYDVDGYVVGAEAAGGPGAEKRIDVLAAAIVGGLSVEQLASLDLCYASPFAQVRDAINAAANVAVANLAGMAAPWTPKNVAASTNRVLVDVRPKKDFDAGNIEGSHHIELSQLRGSKKELSKLGRGGSLVFVSSDGAQGYLAARIARAQGHANAGYLAGGLHAWRAAALEVCS